MAAHEPKPTGEPVLSITASQEYDNGLHHTFTVRIDLWSLVLHNRRAHILERAATDALANIGVTL